MFLFKKVSRKNFPEIPLTPRKGLGLGLDLGFGCFFSGGIFFLETFKNSGN